MQRFKLAARFGLTKNSVAKPCDAAWFHCHCHLIINHGDWNNNVTLLSRAAELISAIFIKIIIKIIMLRDSWETSMISSFTVVKYYQLSFLSATVTLGLLLPIIASTITTATAQSKKQNNPFFKFKFVVQASISWNLLTANCPRENFLCGLVSTVFGINSAKKIDLWTRSTKAIIFA